MRIPTPQFASPALQLRVVLVCLLLGLFTGQFVPYNQAWWPIVMGLVCSAAFFSAKRVLLGAAVLSACLGLAYGSWQQADTWVPPQLWQKLGNTATIVGTVESFPDIRQQNTRATLNIDTIDGQAIDTKILLIVPPETTLHYGQILRITGAPQRIRNFTPDFDYQAFLARRGIYGILRNPERITIENWHGGNPILRSAYWARTRMGRVLEQALPRPHNQIAMGILLGIRNEMPAFADAAFRQSGLQHLLVASGYNVTIVVLAVTVLFGAFGRRTVLGVSLVAITGFVLLSGAEPPILRAAFMGGIAGFGVAFGRGGESMNILLFAAALLGILYPTMVHADWGFWLSCTAVFGILLLTPRIEYALGNIPNILGLRTLLAVTVGAQIAVTPLLLILFGQAPMGGWFANLLAEPLVPYGMGLSVVALVGGALPGAPLISQIFAFPAFAVLEALLWLADVFQRFPALTPPVWVGYVWGAAFFVFTLFQLFAPAFATPQKTATLQP